MFGIIEYSNVKKKNSKTQACVFNEYFLKFKMLLSTKYACYAGDNKVRKP